MLTLDEKIEIINKSSSIEEVQGRGIMPDPDSSQGYYFVSYSHKDYKNVFCIILRLIEQGVKLWYDRGLETGKSWLQDVRKKIYSYDCKGVILFISDNCLNSPSLLSEYAMIRQYRKSGLLVELDFTVLYKVKLLEDDNITTQMLQAFSAGKDFPLLKEEIPPETYEFVRAAFTTRIRGMVSYDEPIEVYKMRLSKLPMPSLLKFTEDKKLDDSKEDEPIGAAVNRINDIAAREITVPQKIKFKGEKVDVVGISQGCFANCVYLEKFKMPQHWRYIDEYAFYNCERLQNIDLGAPNENAVVHMNAFDGCISLKELHVPANATLGGKARHIEKIEFAPDPYVVFCLKDSPELKEVILPSKIMIDTDAFKNCRKMRDFVIPADCIGIETGAFYGCESLEQVRLPQKLDDIMENAFCGCTSLKEVTFPDMPIMLGDCAFKDCKKLSSINVCANSIGSRCFAGCENIADVTIRGKKVRFGKDIFNGCTNLHSITLDIKAMLPSLEENDNKTLYPADHYCKEAQVIYLSRKAKKNIPSKEYEQTESDKQGFLKFIRRGL